jgi:hypothetical protein
MEKLGKRQREASRRNAHSQRLRLAKARKQMGSQRYPVSLESKNVETNDIYLKNLAPV